MTVRVQEADFDVGAELEVESGQLAHGGLLGDGVGVGAWQVPPNHSPVGANLGSHASIPPMTDGTVSPRPRWLDSTS